MVLLSINKHIVTIGFLVLTHVKLGISMLLMLAALQSFSQIAYKGGILEESEHWTSDSIYVVYQDLIVPNGVNLSMGPGVVVKINYARGIIIDEGGLRVSGTQSDSVTFMPNHSNPGQMWKWKGLVIKNAGIENESYLGFAQINDAETAVKLEDCRNVIIENSSMVNCQNLGVQIVNSSFIFLINCNMENNYDGVEIIAGYLGSSSDNVIYNCVIRNQNHNIYIFGEEGGINQNNILSGNLIESGNNGIWIDNSDGLVNSGNVIEQNLILNNGSDIGYGLYLAHDSTTVANNIFWKNNIAVFSEDKGDNGSIINNSFYENNWAIVIGPGSEGNRHLNNTFSLTSNVLLEIKETINMEFISNNMLHNIGLEDIIVNYTNFDLSIPNNFWGTTDTSQINKLIYDKLDNPDLGELNYLPYLHSIDTSNPVSPPYKPIKQIVGNSVALSWNENQEADLMGYRVYQGDYFNYGFSQKYEAGIDTMFVFTGDISIYDPIAVTAFDSSVINDNAQLSGHESPFAFAVIYPYAGNDTIICKHLSGLEIVNSNVPMEYESLFWTTSGDGFFNDPNILQPKYFPGTMDIDSGGALISLNVVSSNKLLVDSFILSIIDDPQAFAGNDTVVIADSEISLVDAIAQNFDSVSWFTSGDGVFNNDKLVNPVYYPGVTDTESGIVFLEIIVYSICGTANDTVSIVIEPHYSIEGKLWTTGRSENQGVVIAYKRNDEDARAVQIESTGSDGAFRFEKVMKGEYYLYALPDTNNPDNAVPGYYANKLRWQSAYLLPVDADVYDIDIQLPSTDFQLPVGEGSISGHMVLPQNSKFNSDIYCTPWFDYNNEIFCRGGLSNVTVLLFNHTKSKLLDYTLTDELGDFYFSRLPYGAYVVDAEKAGFLSIASPIINLSPEYKNETGVVLEITQHKIGIYFDSNESTTSSTTVFPNPATNEINIPYSNPLFLSLRIDIYDIYGNMALVRDIPSGNISSVYNIDISGLSPGLYFGKVNNSNQTVHFRFLVR